MHGCGRAGVIVLGRVDMGLGWCGCIVVWGVWLWVCLVVLVAVASSRWLHAVSDAFSDCGADALFYALLHGIYLVSQVCHFILDGCHFALDLGFNFLLNHIQEFIFHFFAKLG
jgi:hypothetical protein